MIRSKKIRILIIDDTVEFSTTLSLMLEQYSFEVINASTKLDAIETLVKLENSLDLVILNIDFSDRFSPSIFQEINTNYNLKIILLSSEDIGKKRDNFFAKGILDYHLKNKKIDYIVDEVVESLNFLEVNKRERILIIESSEQLSSTLFNMLSNRNYNVLVAHNAQDGLEILKNEEISLLVLDMELKDISSLDLLEGLRDMYLLNNFFVLAISSDEQPSIVRDVLKGGAQDLLKKPFLYEEFILKIDILVKSSRTKKIMIEQNQQIENSLKRFKELLDASIGAMFIFEKNICLNCNNEAISLLGHSSKADILNKEIFEIFTDISEQYKIDILDNKIDHYFEDSITNKKGIQYDVQFKERNIYTDNKILKIISVLDITEVKKRDKLLSQQSKMASMGEMMGNIAHQWRQPLTAISVAAGGIKLNYEFDMEDREETIQELDNIVKNTQFLSTTIESFQNFLKVDKVKSKFDIRLTIKKTLAIINANLTKHNIEVIEKVNNSFYLKGIENELVQVLLNIINNASDALKSIEKSQYKKFILISTEEVENRIVVIIKDNAHGIPTEILSKVFEPYFTTKHQSQGTGLGLYMSHQIVENMEGTIKVENEQFLHENIEYLGAKFILTFPLEN